MSQRLAVTSADFIRSIGYWQGEAMRQPVYITHHGRERLVLAAPELLRNETPMPALDHAGLAQIKASCAAVLENMDEAFLAFDAALRIIGVNTTAEAFIGAARAELQQRTVFDALPDPLAAVLADRLQRVLKSRKAETFESAAFDGRHAAVRVFPTPEGAAALLHNITEQHVLRREREETLALQTAMNAHERLALLKLDARGRIESADATFCEWTGFNPAELAGHRLSDLSVIGARRDLAAAFERVLREAKPLRMHLTVLGKKGDEIAGRVSIAPIQTDFVARGAQALWTRQDFAELSRGAA